MYNYIETGVIFLITTVKVKSLVLPRMKRRITLYQIMDYCIGAYNYILIARSMDYHYSRLERAVQSKVSTDRAQYENVRI